MADQEEIDGQLELIESITFSILNVIPVTQDKARQVAIGLCGLNLTRMEQLAYVMVTDLTEWLGPLDARQLIEAWKAGSDKDQNKETRAAPQVIHARREDEEEVHFKVNWKDIYAINKDIKKKMVEGKKLKRKEKKQIVARCVQQVRDSAPHAERTVFDGVARQLKKKYPVTFKSELAKGTLARKTLGFKMKTKFDNDRRPARRSTTEQQAPSLKAAYGCVLWRQVDLPEGETEETMEEKRQKLEEYFESTRPSAWDWTHISEQMSTLYGLQRAQINQQAEEIVRAKKALRKKDQQGYQPAVVTTTSQLRDRWPFLFVPSGMMIHFSKLTDINLEEKFESFIDNELDKLIEFMISTNPDKKKKTIIKKMEKAKQELKDESTVPTFAAGILLLVQRFKENKEALFLMVDALTPEEEISQSVELPPTPCIIIRGPTVFTEDVVYFSMDGQLLGTADGFVEGMAMVLASYFVFNLDYAPQAQITLEFMQRVIAEINPNRGNKRPAKSEKGRASTKSVHHLLSQFNDKYEDYLAEKSNSEESETEEL